MKLKENINQSGLTVIQLSVVAAVVVLAISVGIFFFVNLQIQARESQRLSDLGAFKKGMELYRLTNQDLYPKDKKIFPDEGQGYNVELLSTLLVPDFMSYIPEDPKSGGVNYQYAWGDGGAMFAIKAFMSNDIGGDDCVFRSEPRPGRVNNLFSGLPDCDL